MILALLGCSTSVSPFAGFVVTTETFLASGQLLGRERDSYDDDGRLVSTRSESHSSIEEWTATWEGDCRVRAEEVRTYKEWDEEETLAYAWTCDDAGNPTRMDRTYVDVTDGVEQTILVVVTYDNSYDADGRLTRVADTTDGEPGQVRLRGWGGCDDPTLSTYQNAGGDSGVTSLTCRVDGQVDETWRNTFDVDGSLVDVGRGRHRYDLFGREVVQIFDDGPGTEEQLRWTWAWEDPFAPGATRGETLRAGVLSSFWTATYE